MGSSHLPVVSRYGGGGQCYISYGINLVIVLVSFRYYLVNKYMTGAGGVGGANCECGR